MRDRLNPQSPIPLYWQVAEALRYQVATGELSPGERLPSLREAAQEWGVNLHTIRRAYRELAEIGIVQVRARSGAVVRKPPGGRGDTALPPAGLLAGSRRGVGGRYAGLEGWLGEVVRHGTERWGLGPRELGAALSDLPWPGRPTDPIIVVECSEIQAADLARQLADRWRVVAEPWSLEREGEPAGDAVVVGTFFHYNDIRVRWPHRFPQVRFVATRPDHSIAERLAIFRRDSPGPLPVVLWESDEAMGRNIVADLLRILPRDGFAVRQQVGVPEDAQRFPPGPILFSPRMWARLPEEARRRRDFLEVRYIFEPRDVERTAQELGWERR